MIFKNLNDSTWLAYKWTKSEKKETHSNRLTFDFFGHKIDNVNVIINYKKGIEAKYCIETFYLNNQ